MAVHLLRLPNEPAEWAVKLAYDLKSHIAPEWPESARYALIAVVRNPGPRDKAHTRALWVTTKEEMDRLLTRHAFTLQWFTVARHKITDDMIERTLTEQEHLP
jgi:hypothetical protein